MYSAVLIKEEALLCKKDLKRDPRGRKSPEAVRTVNNRGILDLKRLGETEPFSDEADMELAFEGGARMVLGEHYRILHSDVKLLSLG